MASTVQFKYFDLTPLKIYGRGGVVRMLMLHNNIPFEEESFAFDTTGSWPANKQKIIKSGANPSGSLPCIEVDGFQLSEHNAICRYLCRLHNVKSKRIEIDAVSDMILDKVVPLRDGQLNAVLCGDESAKARWPSDRREHYRILDTVIAKYGHPESGLISGSCDCTTGLMPSDFSLYCVLHDDSRLFGSCLDDFASLQKLMATLSKVPSIENWAREKDYLPTPF